jgi:hypothetical protein
MASLLFEYKYLIAALIITFILILFLMYKFKDTKGSWIPMVDICIKIIGLTGIIISVGSYINSNENTRKNNEMDRKQTSLSIILNIQDKIGRGLHCTAFLSDMSEEEMKKIINFEKINIDNEHHRNELSHCLVAEKLDSLLKLEKNQTTLTEYGSYYVLYQATHDLNFLETLAAARCSGIVDNGMIDKLFGGTFMAKKVEGFIGRLRINNFKHYEYLEKYIQSEGKECPSEKTPL